MDALKTMISLQMKSNLGKGLDILCISQILFSLTECLTECLENEENAAAFKTKGPQNSA